MPQKLFLETTISFLSYRYTQRAVTARRHFQNGGYMALLEAKTGLFFYVAQKVRECNQYKLIEADMLSNKNAAVQS